jgi:hypothetical protein
MSLFLILYFILASGPHIKIHFYSLYATLGLEILFIILWIVAAALSTYKCPDLCTACANIEEGDGYNVWVGSLFCECFEGSVIESSSAKRDLPSQIFRRVPTSSFTKSFEKGAVTAVKKGLDAAMMFVTPAKFLFVLLVQ